MMDAAQYFEQFAGDTQQSYVIDYHGSLPNSHLQYDPSARIVDAIFEDYLEAAAHVEERRQQNPNMDFHMHAFSCPADELLCKPLPLETYHQIWREWEGPVTN